MNSEKIIKRVYLAGPVTDQYYRTTYDRFQRAKLFMLSQGFDEVVNPCEIIAPGTGWTESMLLLLPYLAVCNYIAILPGYERSNGTMCEYYFSRGMEKEGKLEAIIHLAIPKENKLEISQTEVIKQTA